MNNSFHFQIVMHRNFHFSIRLHGSNNIWRRDYLLRCLSYFFSFIKSTTFAYKKPITFIWPADWTIEEYFPKVQWSNSVIFIIYRGSFQEGIKIKVMEIRVGYHKVQICIQCLFSTADRELVISAKQPSFNMFALTISWKRNTIFFFFMRNFSFFFKVILFFYCGTK